MDIHELAAESAELLPGREALGKLSFSFAKPLNVTKNVTIHSATVNATNTSTAANYCSPEALAQGEAEQSISISQ
jgi:hypothetical protein